jgi:hypothetical protein
MTEYQFDELPEEVEVDGKRYIRKDLVQVTRQEQFMAALDPKVEPAEYRRVLEEAASLFLSIYAMSTTAVAYRGSIPAATVQLLNTVVELTKLVKAGFKPVDELQDQYTEV